MQNQSVIEAHAFLAGTQLSFADANALWLRLQRDDEISRARAVLAHLREGNGLLDQMPPQREIREELCRQEALLTSKDPELSAAVRHDRALQILAQQFYLDDPALDGDAETLGIAGGIFKRRWSDLGQLDDLIQSAKLYARGAKGDLGADAYAHINAAFLQDLLADAGVDPDENHTRARALRQRIVDDLPAIHDDWWNTASRAEALFGLQRYDEATSVVAGAKVPEPWRLQTFVQQLATLARLQEPRPLEVPAIRKFFDAVLPGAADAVRSSIAGKVGLALSGGGFRASFYHLGVLARLAELDVLRRVEVLSCVSGGSIVGACYWLALRARLLDPRPLGHQDYVDLVRDLIKRFEQSVATGLRESIQPGMVRVAWRFLRGEKGALDPEHAAQALEEHFYRPLWPVDKPLYMHDLPFTPADHKADLAGSREFQPCRHNWLRAHKVPVLVLNATTVNTAHAWQFTPTWMGESPWAVHESADSIPRLEWSWYEPAVDWQMPIGRAVAASACVPGVFAPLRLDGAYDGITVQLVDGGVHDNQGTVSLLAQNCNVLLVSDACGQLLLEEAPTSGLAGSVGYAGRSMSILMERVRLANYADLSARERSGLLRGFMFLHMKAGLDADIRRLRFSQESYQLRRSILSPSGVRKDFQQALAELRTDLNAFTLDESRSLMACGYQMAKKTFERDLAKLTELWETPLEVNWPFAEHLSEITSTAATTPKRKVLLDALRAGSKVQI